MLKRFKEWIEVKEKLHTIDENKIPLFKEGEIWWCGIGDNIGSEINGKSNYFSRPVFIFKKFSKDIFFGLPLTSKIKMGTWFVNIDFLSNRQTIVLNQGRTFNTRRLYTLMCQCDEKTVTKIKADFRRLYLDIPFPKKRSWEIPKLFLYISKIISLVKFKKYE